MESFFCGWEIPLARTARRESAGGVAVCCSVSPAFHVPPLWLLLAWGSGPLGFPSVSLAGWLWVSVPLLWRAVPPQGNTRKKRKKKETGPALPTAKLPTTQLAKENLKLAALTDITKPRVRSKHSSRLEKAEEIIFKSHLKEN